MATYAIGDIHGCSATLNALLERCAFDPGTDRIWAVGDLVSRGPDSLGVVRRLKDLGEGAVCVLGNHDVHLLGCALGVPGFRMRAVFEPFLKAPDFEELLAWLASRPLLHREGGRVLVHAGLLPAWDVERAYALAGECEELLQGEGIHGLLAASRDKRRRWHEDGSDLEKQASFLRAVTLLRLVDEDGQMVPSFLGGRDEIPPGSRPWFDAPQRRSREVQVIFGHWSMLGLMVRQDAVCLDTGCVWNGKLTAYRLEDGAIFQEPLADRLG